MNWWREQEQDLGIKITWKELLGGFIGALMVLFVCAMVGMIQQELECRNGYQPSCVDYVVPDTEDNQ
jgi:hypothetical protein